MSDTPIVFLEHHQNYPTHSAYDDEDRPDIFAVWGPASQYNKVEAEGRTDYKDVPHYRVLSLVECKPEKERGRASYAYQLLESRGQLPNHP